MRCILVVLALVLAIAASAQSAAVSPDACRKELKIDEFLLPEDAAAAKHAFETFQHALLSGNRKQVIALVSFPTTFVVNGYPLTFSTDRALEKKYNKIFTAYVIRSVRDQRPEELLAGWEGVSLANGAVKFTRNEEGSFHINDVRPKLDPPPDSLRDFFEHRLTCPPVVIEGRIVAYNWLTHIVPGFEGIYGDHFIVDIVNVVSGQLPQKRIRVDFWGVAHLPEYNLPPKAFEPGFIWRMYLRPSDAPPQSEDICNKDVQEWFSDVDPTGREVGRHSAIRILIEGDSLTYAGLPCFEVHKQFFSQRQ